MPVRLYCPAFERSLDFIWWLKFARSANVSSGAEGLSVGAFKKGLFLCLWLRWWSDSRSCHVIGLGLVHLSHSSAKQGSYTLPAFGIMGKDWECTLVNLIRILNGILEAGLGVSKLLSPCPLRSQREKANPAFFIHNHLGIRSWISQGGIVTLYSLNYKTLKLDRWKKVRNSANCKQWTNKLNKIHLICNI